MDRLVAMLRAAGDPTRLRLLLLLRQAELTVSELVEIVGQSQPRVSRHLKLLGEAGLLERFKEGSWVFYRAADRGQGAELSRALAALADPGLLETDRVRLGQIRKARAAAAAAYFRANAAEWERIRALHAPEKDVEAAILTLLTAHKIENLLDAGTGTGRMLELLSPYVTRAVGVDVSPEMLAIARDRLARENISHAQVRLADTYIFPFAAASFDAVLIHQVLHYLDDPGAAVGEAARVMTQGGRLLIADFAPHDLEFLREDYAHRRLGFSDREVEGWLAAAGLGLTESVTIAPGHAKDEAASGEKLTVKIWLATKGSPMSLKDMIANERPISVSFEFSPPKTDEAEAQLWTAIQRLAPLQPSFVSVTYGAGGSTRERTHATVKRIVEETSLKPAAHLTCVAASRAEIDEIVQDYWDAGIRHIVALRGDMPGMDGPYRPHPDGYQSTPELIEGIRRIAPFEVSVSFYPERHPDLPSHGHDIELLKAKMDAGASRALGQFCFDNEATARFRDDAVKAGVTIPVIPGIMPTTGFKGVERMAGKIGASIPGWLSKAYEGLEEDVEARRIVATAVLADQVQQLRALGFDQLHFYPFNQANLIYAACHLLGLRPKELS